MSILRVGGRGERGHLHAKLLIAQCVVCLPGHCSRIDLKIDCRERREGRGREWQQQYQQQEGEGGRATCAFVLMLALFPVSFALALC